MKMRKEAVSNKPSLFETMLIRTYQIAFVVFTLWLGWVIVDEVKMQRDAVSVTARVYDVNYISADQLAAQGRCYRSGRMANCHDLYSFRVDYQANGQLRTGRFKEIIWHPDESKTVCIDYVKHAPEMIKLCQRSWFDYHKAYSGVPICFWLFTLIALGSCYVIRLVEGIKKRLWPILFPPLPKEIWYRVYDSETQQLLLETSEANLAHRLVHERIAVRITSDIREIVKIAGKKTERSWIIYEVSEAPDGLPKKRRKKTAQKKRGTLLAMLKSGQRA